MSDNLTTKQDMACRLFALEGKTKSDAYRGSYNTENMKPSTINRKAKKLFDEDKIRARVYQLKKERCKRMDYDSDKLLKQLSDMLSSDILDIFNNELGTFKPLKEWPLIWRQRLDSFETKEIYSKESGEKKLIGYYKKAKFVPVSKLLELIGKHVEVGAYANIQKYEACDNLAERLDIAIKRREIST